jgi:hypothetical protein
VQDLFKAGALFGSGFTPFHTTTKSGKPITDDAQLSPTASPVTGTRSFSPTSTLIR